MEGKARLEAVITSLENELVSLQAQLDETNVTNEDIGTIEVLAAKISAGLDNAHLRPSTG